MGHVRPRNAAGTEHVRALFNVLGYFTRIDDIGPKFVMCVAFLIVNFLLFKRLHENGPSKLAQFAYWLFVPVNALVVGVVAWYGQNDTLVAAFLGLAVLARFQRRFVIVGVLIGLATLLKFYPLILLPFFCLDERRLELRPLLAGVGTVVAGFVIGLAVWGEGIRAALSAGVDRGPKLLSVLAAWSDHPELGGDSGFVRFLIERNAAVVTAACAVVFVVVYLLRLSWIESATLAYLSVMLTYKVGHQQLFVPLLFLFVGLLIAGTPRALWLAYCCVPFAIFLSFFELGYAWLTDSYTTEGYRVRRDVGFLAAAVGTATIAAFVTGVFVRLRPNT